MCGGFAIIRSDCAVVAEAGCNDCQEGEEKIVCLLTNSDPIKRKNRKI